MPSKRGKKRRTGERNNIAEICATTVLDGLHFARRPFQLPPRMASLLVVVEATLQDADSKQRPDPGVGHSAGQHEWHWEYFSEHDVDCARTELSVRFLLVVSF